MRKALLTFVCLLFCGPALAGSTPVTMSPAAKKLLTSSSALVFSPCTGQYQAVRVSSEVKTAARLLASYSARLNAMRQQAPGLASGTLAQLDDDPQGVFMGYRTRGGTQKFIYATLVPGGYVEYSCRP